MSITYRQLKSFVALANSSTFAEAAEKLHLSQPALSLSIKKIEQQLGGALLCRNTRKVTLSPEGAEFLPVAERLLGDWDSAISDLQNLFAMRRGKLNIAAMPSFAASRLPAMLQRFHKHYTNININVIDVVMEDVIQRVREGRAEIGFTFESESMEGLDFEPLFVDRFIAVVPADSALAKESAFSWYMLEETPFIAMNRGSAIRKWVDELCARHGISLNIATEASQLGTLGQFVRHDLGVSIVPGICQEHMQDKGVVCLPIKEDWLVRPVGMIRLQRTALSVPATKFWEECIIR